MVQISLARGWKLDVERGPDWLFVRPHRLSRTALDSPSFAEQVWSTLQQNFTHRLVLEMADFERLDSHLIGELLWLYERIHGHDGMMRICGLSSSAQDLLQRCRLEERFQLCRDREEAVMGHSRPTQPR
ncbi:MAG: STAS domain-containing protein [Planctomycetia bacterium]|nr:STAS domain-containing protein [Planctomycetia bacterium]